MLGTFIKLSMISILLTGCDPGFNTIPYTDPDFNSYISQFEYYYGHEVDVPITYSELPGNWIGVCTVGPDGFKEILVSPIAWANLLENQRINLIFHELGHCVLGRYHDNMITVDGCPTSFMNIYNISSACLDKHMDDYIEEMF